MRLSECSAPQDKSVWAKVFRKQHLFLNSSQPSATRTAMKNGLFFSSIHPLNSSSLSPGRSSYTQQETAYWSTPGEHHHTASPQERSSRSQVQALSPSITALKSSSSSHLFQAIHSPSRQITCIFVDKMHAQGAISKDR